MHTRGSLLHKSSVVRGMSKLVWLLRGDSHEEIHCSYFCLNREKKFWLSDQITSAAHVCLVGSGNETTVIIDLGMRLQ